MVLVFLSGPGRKRRRHWTQGPSQTIKTRLGDTMQDKLLTKRFDLES
jgi:hypothetical protein